MNTLNFRVDKNVDFYFMSRMAIGFDNSPILRFQSQP